MVVAMPVSTLAVPPASAVQELPLPGFGDIVVQSRTDSGAGTTVRSFHAADGDRLVRRDPTGTTLYLGPQEVRLDKASGTATTTRYYTHGGLTIAMRSAGTLSWLAGDHQGTTQVAINANDLTVRQRRQTPFGAQRGPAVSMPGERAFVGGTNDASTGLLHLGARDYDADLGRFISLDPIMRPTDPQQINGYNYANNSPVSLSDPSGTEPCRTNCDCMYTGNCGGGSGGWTPPVAPPPSPKDTKHAYPTSVGKDTPKMSPKQRRATWENRFSSWKHLPVAQRPADFAQFEFAFCSEFPDVRSCDPSPPGWEETLQAAIFFLPWGGAARIGGELVAAAVGARASSVIAGGTIPAGARTFSAANAGRGAGFAEDAGRGGGGFRAPNPAFPPDARVMGAMKEQPINVFGFDCSEIATNLQRAAGGEGKVVSFKGAGDDLLVREGSSVSNYSYHHVYTDGRYAYDPRMSADAIPWGDYMRTMKSLNPGLRWGNPGFAGMFS